MNKRHIHKSSFDNWRMFWTVVMCFGLIIIFAVVIYAFVSSTKTAKKSSASAASDQSLEAMAGDKELITLVKILKQRNDEQDAALASLKETVEQSAKDIRAIKEAIRMMNESSYVTKRDSKEMHKEYIAAVTALEAKNSALNDKLKNLFEQIIQLQQDMNTSNGPETKRQIKALKSALEKFVALFPTSSQKTRAVQDELNSIVIH